MRGVFDRQHESSEDKEEGNVLFADSNAEDVTGTELSAIFGPGASGINFDPVKSSTPTREDPNKRGASVDDEGDDSREEVLSGLDLFLKKPRLDLSTSDSDDGTNLDVPVSPVPGDPSYVLTIHDAGGGGVSVSSQASPLKEEDNEDSDTGGGHEKIVSGVGGTVVNDVGDQGELADQGGEGGVGQGEPDLQVVDKGGGHEAGDPSEIVAQNGGSSDGGSRSEVSNMRQQDPFSE